MEEPHSDEDVPQVAEKDKALKESLMQDIYNEIDSSSDEEHDNEKAADDTPEDSQAREKKRIMDEIEQMEARKRSQEATQVLNDL